MTERPPGRLLCLAVAVVFVSASMGNLAAFPQLQEDGSSTIRPIVRADSPDPRQVGLDYSSTVRRRDGLYLQLGLVAQDATLHLGRGTDLDLRRLRGLARVDVRVAAYESTSLAADPDVVEHLVVDEEGGRLGPVPFTIALLDADVDALAVRVEGERHDFIDLRLIPADERAGVLE